MWPAWIRSAWGRTFCCRFIINNGNEVASSEWITCIARRTSANWTVIFNSTLCIKTACIWAWILTFLIDTGFIKGAFAVNNAFRPTIGWRTDISFEAWANSLIVYFTTLTVGSARWRMARIESWCSSRRKFSTLKEWISSCANRTRTNRNVIFYIAQRIKATCASTWVYALILNASKTWRTIGMEFTFVTTTFIWVAFETGQAVTCTGSVSFFTHCIKSTGARLTRIWSFCGNCCNNIDESLFTIEKRK